MATHPEVGSWFGVPDEHELPEDLRKLFAKARERIGFVPNVFRAYSFRPERLRLCRERPPGFALAATVASVSYLGGASIVHLVAGGGRPMKVRLPAGADCPPRGAAVWASWLPDEGVLITQ